MNIKEFLKPDWRKAILFLIIIVISYVFSSFPSFYNLTYFECIAEAGGCDRVYFIQRIFRVVDFIILYIISCLIVYAYDRYRGKR